jgi:hypothetical protein
VSARWRAALLLAACGLVHATPARAQSCTFFFLFASTSCSINTSTSLTVPRILQLTVAPSPTTLTTPTSTDFDAGYSSGVGPTVTVRANTAWTLQVRAQAATWTATNTVAGVTARTNKPSTDLQFSGSAGGPFTALSNVTSITTTGAATANTVQTEYYRVLWSWTLDKPGSYSLTVLYTITSP